jgi:hypothetical protein
MTFPAERMRRLFFAGLGVVFVLAFASLGVQIAGLIGSHGILPAQELLTQVREQVVGTAYEHAFAHGPDVWINRARCRMPRRRHRVQAPALGFAPPS